MAYDFSALARQFGYAGPQGMEEQFIAGLIDAQGNPTTGTINMQGGGLPADIWRSTLPQAVDEFGNPLAINPNATQMGTEYHDQLSNELAQNPAALQDWMQRTEKSDPSLFSSLLPFIFSAGVGGMVGAAGAGGGLGAGSSGLAEGGALASEAGFLPGSFELGTGLGSTAAEGLGLADAIGAGTGASGLGGIGNIGGGLASDAGFVPGSFELGTGAASTATGGLGAADIAAGVGGVGTGAGSVTGAGNAISNLWPEGTPDWLKGLPWNNILQGGLQGGLGMLGADKMADAYQNVANQNLALGAPFRGMLEQSYQPGFDLASQPGYGDAFNRMADISSRSWSAKAGNPFGSPTAQAGILSDVWNQSYLPTMSNYRGQLGQFGGLGLNTAGAAQLGGAQQAGGGLDAIGYGVGTAMQQQPDWSKMFGGMNLNIGGMPWGRR